MATINRPFVAVITQLRYNSSHVIQAIESVRAQTMQDYIHFIVDDKSDDYSRNMVQNYITTHPDAHIIFASFGELKNDVESKNILIQHALVNKPDYFAFLNPSDQWLPTHLEDCIRLLTKENAEMACSQPIFVDYYGNHLTDMEVPTDKYPTFASLSVTNTIPLSTVVATKKCIDTVGEFDANLTGVEDWDYWLRVLGAGFQIVRGNFQTVKCDITVHTINNIDSAQKMFIFKRKHNFMTDTPLKLNLGCGNEILKGYVNCDLHNPKADMWFDASSIPFPDNSIDEIRAYHLIEHFSFSKGLEVVKEWFRVLKPNGKLVLETPDFYHNCKKFVESDEQTRIQLYVHFFAWPDEPGQAHLFLYTETQMAWTLSGAGFTNVKRQPPDSVYAQPNPHWQELYLKMEATKPSTSPTVGRKGKVYDCFLFFNEYDLLKLRLNELKDVVDKFVLVEANTTFTGQPKPYYFNEKKAEFAEYKDKIIHIMLDRVPQTGNPWDAEYYQRDALYRGLTNCSDDDIVMISDVDEIPNPEAVKNYNPVNGISMFKQRMSFYYFNCVSNASWWNAKIGTWREMKKDKPSAIRLNNALPEISDGGWHFTGLGGVSAIQNKLAAFSHRELNVEEVRNTEKLLQRIRLGMDIYNRPVIYGMYTKIDDTFPKTVRENKGVYEAIGYLSPYGLPFNHKKLRAANQPLFDETFQDNSYDMYPSETFKHTFIDIGANIGLVTIQAAMQGAKKLYAYEPNPENYAKLKELTVDYPNIVPIQKAVFAEGINQISITNEGMTSHITLDGSGATVEAVTLQQVFSDLAPDDYPVVKMDCEGAEFDILYTSPAQVIQRIRLMYIEIHNHPKYPNGVNQLIAYLTSLGFECKQLPFAHGIWYPDGTFKTSEGYASYKCINTKLK